MTIVDPVPGEAHAAAVDAVVGVPAVLPVPHQLARHPRHQQGCGQDHQTQSGDQSNYTCLIRCTKKEDSFNKEKTVVVGLSEFYSHQFLNLYLWTIAMLLR